LFRLRHSGPGPGLFPLAPGERVFVRIVFFRGVLQRRSSSVYLDGQSYYTLECFLIAAEVGRMSERLQNPICYPGARS
jgi:hypothetical protein